MYKKFGLITVSISAIEKTVTAHFNFDVDSDTVGISSIRLTEYDGTNVNHTIKVNGSDIILSLHDWKQDAVYYLIIDSKVSNIVGETLGKPIRYEINIVPEITSTVTILSPYNFESLSKLLFTVEDNENLESYYIEIANENVFYTTVYKGMFKGQKFAPVIADIKEGQYYARCRCQIGDKYGKWSDTVTFLYSTEQTGETADVLADNDIVEVDIQQERSLPVAVETELEMISYPISGETPEQFIFEFDKELDILNSLQLTVVRRDF